jgi:hypothetical protein
VTEDRAPLATFENATVWYYEAAAAAPVPEPDHLEASRRSPTRHEGPVEIYDSWVRLGGLGARHWVPRETVEGVSER